MNKGARPTTVLIAAMGGEGGGVLTAWLANAAREAGLIVQVTSTPGVAQRTGATVYYLEMMEAAADGAEPLMDIFPGPGNIDLMLATELVEAGRVLERGFVSPERTTLIASSHRVYSLTEKMAMGDGRIDGKRVLDAARELAKKAIVFDIERTAKDCGGQLNAVVLGAAAGAGVLPIAPEIFENVIREEGKAVSQNLAGFAAGLARARGAVAEPRPGAAETAAPGPAKEDSGTAAALRGRIELDYPPSVHDMVIEATGRTLDFQDRRYAELFLDRLRDVLAIDQRRG
ncbi:MAG: 2-oxoacid:acceptor oxidoreductase family protein, partial [Alphaproteobacteria bacterium]